MSRRRKLLAVWVGLNALIPFLLIWSWAVTGEGVFDDRSIMVGFLHGAIAMFSAVGFLE